MMSNPTSDLNNNDLSDIRDAVPALDLLAIRSLKRAGFKIVRHDTQDRSETTPAQNPGWQSDRPQTNTAA